MRELREFLKGWLVGLALGTLTLLGFFLALWAIAFVWLWSWFTFVEWLGYWR